MPVACSCHILGPPKHYGYDVTYFLLFRRMLFVFVITFVRLVSCQLETKKICLCLFRHGYGHQVTPVYHGTPAPAAFHGTPTPAPFRGTIPTIAPLLNDAPPPPHLLARDGPFFVDGAKK